MNTMLKRWARRAGAALVVTLFAQTAALAIEITEVTSPKGVTAWLIQDKTVPLVSLRFAFRGGTAADPRDKAGLADLVSGLLDEGAGDLPSAEFQKRLEEDSISMSFSASLDSFGGSLSTLNETRAKAFELLALALTRPRFDAEPVARVKSQVLAQVVRSAERPSSIAGERWDGVVFGEHPYGRALEIKAATIPSITADDLRKFVESRFARDNLVVGVVGDISAAQLAPLLDQAFGALPAKAASRELPSADVETAGKVVIVEKDIPQTVVVFGQRGIPRDDPDFYAASVMTYILGGGGLTSRLADEVREKRGLAYSVHTRLVNYDHADLLMGWVATQNARVAESMDVIRAEWKRMAEMPVTGEELDGAKAYLTGSYFTRLNSTARIADLLVGLQLERLGIDYITRRNELIGSVTVADVQRVAARLLKPDAITVVMVGKPQGVKATP